LEETTREAVSSRPDVRQALRAGDWPVVLRAFTDAGLSQSAIAARTGLSQSQVSRLASGRSKTPGIVSVRKLCDGLGLPRRLAGLADDPQEEDNTDRRQFLGGSVAALAATAVPHADLRDEQVLLATSLGYRQLEQRTPAASLTRPVTAHLSLAYFLAGRSAGPQQARLSAAAAEIAGLAAWLHADLAQPAEARRFYQMSVAVAARARNTLLMVYMQGSYGQYATMAGDPASGLRLIRDAAGRLPQGAPATARAWLACLEAVALGCLGDKAGLALLAEAERHAATAGADDPVWPWVFRFDAARVAGYRAIAASRLDLVSMASAAFAQADVARSPKQAALVTVEHAWSLAAAGHLDQACTQAAAALDVGIRLESERVRLAVREFRAGPASKAGRRLTAVLDDRLHDAYSTHRA
jgi:transcriptional regulator with XRE-family HTH domain